jgi:hypothetical protein
MTRLPVRQLIGEEILASRPDFKLIDGPSPYTFQRTRQAGGESFYDTILMSSSQKHHYFGAAVMWGLFPTWGGGQGGKEIRAGSDLPILCGRRSMEEQVYAYDGSEAGARAALRLISADLSETAEPWFRKRTAQALAHPLVVLGLEWVRSHPEARAAKQDFSYDEKVRAELSRVLRRRAHDLALGMDIKRNISLLCYHLLEFASEVDGRQPS